MLSSYVKRLNEGLGTVSDELIKQFCDLLFNAWLDNRSVFLCGNGGSAGNAIHLANDFVYGISKSRGRGLKCHALPANQSVMTCLANDVGYEHVYAEQVALYGKKGDLLIILSGSGNSANIINAAKEARLRGMYVIALVGFDGGYVSQLADLVIHSKIEDMQISEDIQLVIGHVVMQYLYERRNEVGRQEDL